MAPHTIWSAFVSVSRISFHSLFHASFSNMHLSPQLVKPDCYFLSKGMSYCLQDLCWRVKVQDFIMALPAFARLELSFRIISVSVNFSHLKYKYAGGILVDKDLFFIISAKRFYPYPLINIQRLQLQSQICWPYSLTARH